MDKKLLLGISVVAFLFIAATALVAVHADTGGKKQANISAADLMPDIEVFPEHWLKGETGVNVVLDGVTLLQFNYYTGTGANLTVNIAVCDTVETAKGAFDLRKDAQPVTSVDNEFEQCFTYMMGGDTLFAFQDQNIYGMLSSWNTGTPLTEAELDEVMLNIKEKILNALK